MDITKPNGKIYKKRYIGHKQNKSPVDSLNNTISPTLNSLVNQNNFYNPIECFFNKNLFLFIKITNQVLRYMMWLNPAKSMNKKHVGYLIIILFIAGYFRFVGVNWDQNQHLHPDERFLTMVATGITWPATFKDYLDTKTSSLNPHNKGFDFYVYGTWPVIFVKWVAEQVNMGSYDGVTIVGRVVSGIIELLTVVLVFIIALLLSKKTNVGLVASGIYACMILPIQLAHFFAVDPYLTFFLTFSFYVLLKKSNGMLLGFVFGLAISAKISALLFFPIVLLGIFFQYKKFTQKLLYCVVFCLCTLITIRLFYPYLFVGFSTFNPLLLANWEQLKQFDGIHTGFPPALQWIPTIRGLFLPLHTYLWGLGIPIGTLTSICILYFFSQCIRNKKINSEILLAILWIGFLLSYQSIQFAKALRYVYPVYPIIAILIGIISISLWEKIRHQKWATYSVYLCYFLILWWAWGCTNIYRKPHTRVQTSHWIYNTIPHGSYITYEVWDDAVPVNLDTYNSSLYRIVGLPMYDPDSVNKWKAITQILEQSDYIAITSNRLWRSLYAIRNRFPITSRYYELLFSGTLGYTNVKTVTSYPCLIPGSLGLADTKTNLSPPPFSFTTTNNCLLALNDDGAEESFTVYDHPKVILFKKTIPYTQNQLFERIYGQQKPANTLR